MSSVGGVANLSAIAVALALRAAPAASLPGQLTYSTGGDAMPLSDWRSCANEREEEEIRLSGNFNLQTEAEILD